MSFSKPKKILVAPLDWGLGHATRCIPVIRELLAAGCEVLIASERGQADLLKKEFPGATHLLLHGYRMKYAKSDKGFGLKMLAQLPRIQKAIRRENIWLREIVQNHRPDAVISDNRYGLHHPEVPSVIMTHQLRIIAPYHGRPEDWLQKVNYRLLKKFRECWVVDFEGENNLAGSLSHPSRLPSLPLKYIGALSRFEKKEEQQPELDLLVLISGPEPQRSIFEQLIRSQIAGLPIRGLVLCGRPGKSQEEWLSQNIRLVSHLPSEALEKALLKSRLVVGRSGYSTIMDLIKMQKKAILIPTPGQTEQEYLATALQKKGYFLRYPQKDFKLKEALDAAAKTTFKKPGVMETDLYKKVIREFLSRL